MSLYTEGKNHIALAFERAKGEGRAALIPYLTLGYPNPGASLELVAAVEQAGADIVELGIPFSDPLADGPTIQQATHHALQQGMTVTKCLEIAQELRARRIRLPLLFMGYYNPILNYGPAAFCQTCCEVGVDGFIIPDLPPEEADEIERGCLQRGLALIYMLAPTSTGERVSLVAKRAKGFIYLVSLTGVTGARDTLPPGLAEFVVRVRGLTEVPLAVGFGISGPAQAREVSRLADGVVIGSAIIRLIRESSDPVREVREFVATLRQSIRTPRLGRRIRPSD